MKRHVLCIIACIGIAAGGLASAADGTGWFVGGAVGHGEVRLDGNYTATADEFDHGHLSWEAALGFRPISWVSAEIEYLNFGDVAYQNGGPEVTGRVKARAAALMGMGYVPLPVPFLDVYGKLGVARTNDSVNAHLGAVICPVNNLNCGLIKNNLWQTSLAYGAGVQFRVAAFAVRAEYERIAASHGQPDLLSLGATFSFGAH